MPVVTPELLLRPRFDRVGNSLARSEGLVATQMTPPCRVDICRHAFLAPRLGRSHLPRTEKHRVADSTVRRDVPDPPAFAPAVSSRDPA